MLLILLTKHSKDLGLFYQLRETACQPADLVLIMGSVHHHRTDMSLNSEFKKVCQWTDLTVAQILEICECEKEDFADDCAEDILMCLNDNGWDHPDDVACVGGYYGHAL